MFADQEADLPEGWEKKLNQQGKVNIILLCSLEGNVCRPGYTAFRLVA